MMIQQRRRSPTSADDASSASVHCEQDCKPSTPILHVRACLNKDLLKLSGPDTEPLDGNVHRAIILAVLARLFCIL